MLSSILKVTEAARRSRTEEVEVQIEKARKEYEVLSDVLKFYLRIPLEDGEALAVDMELTRLSEDHAKVLNKIIELRRKLRTLEGGR